MGRSSTRHKREIYGIDSAGETPEDHGEQGNLPSGLTFTGEMLAETSLELTASECVNVTGLTGIEVKINDDAWVQVTGEVKMSDTVYRFVTPTVDPFDTVFWRYIGGSGTMDLCSTSEDLEDHLVPVVNQLGMDLGALILETGKGFFLVEDDTDGSAALLTEDA